MKEDEKNSKKVYNLIAKEYHKHRTELHPNGWFYNELLEMPSFFELLGNVKDKKILDFGCGTGIHSKILKEKGANVKGFDISPEMVEIAKKENPNLDLRVGSGYDIPFSEKFDIVIASLVMHYISDWGTSFKEINRVLKKGGFFIFSTGNPVVESGEKIEIDGIKKRFFGDYFKERKIDSFWKVKDEDIKVSFYHKTYETIINFVIKNNFEIVGYKDAFPIKKAEKLFPEKYKKYTKIPLFTIWKLKKK